MVLAVSGGSTPILLDRPATMRGSDCGIEANDPRRRANRGCSAVLILAAISFGAMIVGFYFGDR